MNAVKKWWTALRSSADDLDAIEMRRNSELLGADHIEHAKSGEVTTLTGVIDSIVFRPDGKVPILEAVLWDGSGEVSVRWMGRRLIRGVNPGVGISVTGRIVTLDGQFVMFNPNYALLPKGNS